MARKARAEDPSAPLSVRLSPAERERVEAAAYRADIPLTVFARLAAAWKASQSPVTMQAFIAIAKEAEQRTRAAALSRINHNRAVRLGLFSDVTVIRSVVYDNGLGLCGICGLPVARDRFHVDHLIPIAKGGEHSYANTQPSHPSCNLSKGDKMPTIH